MSYLRMVLVSLIALALVGCTAAQPTPAAQPTAQNVAPTSAIGIGSMPGLGQMPTTQTTSEVLTTYTVQRGPIEDVLIFQGQVSPRQFSLSFPQDGVIKEVHVQPGQTVAPDDLVAELDLGDVPSQLSEAELTVNQNQSALNNATQTAQFAVRQAQNNLDLEQAKLDALQAPPTALALAEAQSAVNAAQSNLDKVRNDTSQAKNLAHIEMDAAVQNLQRVQKEYGDVVTRLEKAGDEEAKRLLEQKQTLEAEMVDAEAAIKRAVIAYDTARNNEVALVQAAESQLRLAQAKLDDLRNNRVDPLALVAQQQAVKNAQLALDEARQKATPDPALVRELEASKLLVKQLKDDIAARRLYATAAGEVVSVVSPGTPVNVGAQAVTMIDRSKIEILVSADQLGGSTDGSLSGNTTQSKLSIGQSVNITFSRYPDQVFTGKIVQLPSSADTLNADLSYHIAFETQSRGFDIGDLADMKIIRGHKDSALWLPPAALSSDGTNTYVLVQDGEGTKRVDVITGISTADKVEILSGLKEGDVVVGA